MIGERQYRAFCRPPTGEPVSFAGVSTYSDDGTPICGIVDRSSSIGFGDLGTGGIEMNQPMLRLPFNAFSPMPQSGEAITVNGTPYTVNQPHAVDDGAFLMYPLLEAA